MRKVLIAAAFAVAFAGTAFADAFSSPFYVAIDRSSGHCVMMQFMGAGGPDTHRSFESGPLEVTGARLLWESTTT